MLTLVEERKRTYTKTETTNYFLYFSYHRQQQEHQLNPTTDLNNGRRTNRIIISIKEESLSFLDCRAAAATVNFLYFSIKGRVGILLFIVFTCGPR
jgi:hypothetical protein